MPRNWSYGKKRKSGYRSGAEEDIAKYLMESGIAFEYETMVLQYEKMVRKGVCKNCKSDKSSIVQMLTYTPDFVLENGIVIEYKGRLTSKDRSKYLAVVKANPDVKLRFLFGSDNKLSRGSSKRYSDWASENKLFYHVGKLPPRRWLSSAV